jgi:LuxR family quorum-sensing transcriptional regulator LasR
MRSVTHLNHFDDFNNLFSCRSQQEWRDLLIKQGNDLGFERVLIAIFPDRNAPLEADSAFLQSNYSESWRSKYDNEKMGYVDPTVGHCLNKSTPLIWSPDIFAAPKQKDMYEEASGHGIRSGITLPIHGGNGEVGVLCFVTDTKPGQSFLDQTRHTLPQLSYLRDYLFESSKNFTSRHPTPRIHLTRREIECLKWAANGKSSWDIGRILNCSEATVNFHFSNIRQKFGAVNRQQAVVKAIRMGLLD